MSSSPFDPRDLRVSDDERAHVLALLEKATGRGLIDIDEYTERSGKVIAARTRRDLNAVLIDLPGLQIGGRSVDAAVAATAPVPQPGPGFSGAVPHPAGALELLGWGARTFKGYWSAPSLIVIGGTGASTRLDFTQAQLASSTVTIEFRSNYGGAAEFIVPLGSTVRVDGLQMRGGHVHNKVDPRSGGRGMTLVLTGVKKSGSVSIRHPKGKLRDWLS
ncbi:MAG TPA: DUF1707 domain-containing protein [Nakamurella sp.]